MGRICARMEPKVFMMEIEFVLRLAVAIGCWPDGAAPHDGVADQRPRFSLQCHNRAATPVSKSSATVDGSGTLATRMPMKSLS